MEKIKVKKEQEGDLRRVLLDLYKSGKKEGEFFGEFKELRRAEINPEKIIWNVLEKNFQLN